MVLRPEAIRGALLVRAPGLVPHVRADVRHDDVDVLLEEAAAAPNWRLVRPLREEACPRASRAAHWCGARAVSAARARSPTPTARALGKQVLHGLSRSHCIVTRARHQSRSVYFATRGTTSVGVARRCGEIFVPMHGSVVHCSRGHQRCIGPIVQATGGTSPGQGLVQHAGFCLLQVISKRAFAKGFTFACNGCFVHLNCLG
mmetsp:Transcript_93803/g.235517  ORF Transcript_93803/g.235517 Transcript_93803/m.235517 type:complete len:202 (+) Transcript_93803:566-1171(+)